MSSCLHAIRPAPTFYRAIQADIHQAIGKTNNFSKKLNLSSEAKSEIQWWIVNVHQWNGRPVHLPPSSLIITTDAAKKGGWEGIMQQTQNSGQVDSRGGFSPHKHFRAKGSPFCSEIVCRGLSNDKCSCEAQNRQHTCSSLHQSSGGTKSVDLCNQAQELWKWCLLHQTIVSAEHLPGIHNRDADQASRIFNDRTEWLISPHLLREALSLLAVKPSTDLFTSRLNKQFPIFCSWKPDPDAWKIDAFSFPWIQKGLYAFPPFCLVGKVLAKVIQDTMVSHSEGFSHYTATISEGNRNDFSPSWISTLYGDS